MKTMMIFLSGLLILMVSFLMIPADAHAPSSMSLEYNPGLKELEVSITHTVSDPSFHYVEELTIYRNDEWYSNMTYNNQPDKEQMKYIFDVEAVEGDVLRVEASCNQGGDIQQTLVINDPDADAEEEDTPMVSIGIVSGLVVILAAVVMRRKRIG